MASVLDKYVSGNFRDAAEKMVSCVALYKGDWVYILQWLGGRGNEGTAEIVYLDPNKGGERQVVNFAKAPEDDLQMGPYPLGFVVQRGNLYYTTRAPVRKNRFGLRDDNMMWHLVANGPVAFDGGRIRIPTMTDAWNTGELFPLLKGEYSPKKHLEEIKAGKLSFAPLSRDFAAVRVTKNTCSLYYKTEVAGELDLETKKISLYPSFDHLKERVALTLKGLC